MIKRCIPVLITITAFVFPLIGSEAEEAPKCSQEEVTGFVMVTLLEQVGIKVVGDKVKFLTGDELNISDFNKIVSIDMSAVRERESADDINKRYCSAEVSVTVDKEKLDGMQFSNWEMGPRIFALLFPLADLRGTTDYSVQITEDGSPFVMVGE